MVTLRTKRLIINQSSNSSKSANKIIRENELKVSKTTVNRIRANCPHLILEPRIKTTVLTPVHIERWLNFAQVHMTWNKDWRQVIFSTEKNGTSMVLIVFRAICTICVENHCFIPNDKQAVEAL